VGEEIKIATYDRAHHREYRRKVRLCLTVFETMLGSHLCLQVRTGVLGQRPGWHIEFDVVGAQFQRFLGVIEGCAKTGRTGAQWQVYTCASWRGAE
jgi:hypothetical protein